MSESSKFKFGMMKERVVDGFIKDIMSDIIDFDYSKSYKKENSENYDFINELHDKITSYLQEEKNPENKQYHHIQDQIFTDYLKLKIMGVVRSKPEVPK
ncbi:MAG TPA: hypothetical protein VN704_08720 [Verrucomicrobiae bacterium]|nr:hypothetical protein [Verrucomicrobiae bacterium]